MKHEGWKYIDQLSDDQVCPVDDDLPMPPSAQMPVGLHYCQRYMLGEVRLMDPLASMFNKESGRLLRFFANDDFSCRCNVTVPPCSTSL